MMTEEERQQAFINKLGRERANRLQYIWDNSYPTSSGDIFKKLTKEEIFKHKAKKEGFTEKEISLFLKL